MGPSSLSSWALLIHRALVARGLDGDEMFRRAGMDPANMADPNSRYPLSAVQRLWALAVATTKEPCFGLEVARLWHPTTFHALGYSALASATLREALLCAVRYSHVVSTGARLELRQDDSEVTVIISGSQIRHEAVRASVEAALASLLIMCRQASGQQINPLRVTLTQPHSDCRQGLEAFFHCPVELGATDNCLVFQASELHARLPTANRVLLRANEQVLTQYAARLGHADLVVLVQYSLTQLLPSGQLDEAIVARSLNLSLRSMQRKLKEKGTTFRTLVDQTRCELAQEYLQDSMLAVAEIAYLLGFAEVSSFSRAYRRWTGHAPREGKQ